MSNESPSTFSGPLRNSHFFRLANPTELDDWLASAERIEIPAGQALFEEGNRGDAMYIILKGSVTILASSKDGGDMVLAKLSEGAYFGEQAMLAALQRRNATAVAAEPCRLIRISGTSFREFLQTHDQLADHLREVSTARQSQNLISQDEIFKPFAELLDPALQASRLMAEEFQDGIEIFREGEAGDRVYLVTEEGFARITRNEDGREILLRQPGKNRFFGEPALIHAAQRQATATADGPLQVPGLKGDAILADYARSPALRGYMDCLTSFYTDLPVGGLMTLYRGKFLDKESVTVLHRFAAGPTVTVTRLTEEPLVTVAYYNNRRRTNTTTWQDPATRDIRRELFISRNRPVGVTALGAWPDLGRVHQMILRQTCLHSWQMALFRQTGDLWLEREGEDFHDQAILCRCTGVTRGALHRAVAEGSSSLDELAEKTGASTVCGACMPLLAEIVGHSDTEAAELVAVIPVTREVKSFRLRPRAGTVLVYRPGQHIVLEAQIGGRWVQRTYSLTSPCQQTEYYEITVKREPHGLMSRWLHDELTEHSRLRISRPRGRFQLDIGNDSPVVCFAGGIGITPALSMLRHLRAQPDARPLHIEYSVSDLSQVVYPAELRDDANSPHIRVHTHCSRTQGRFGAEDVARVVARLPSATFFLCGSESYETTVRTHLLQIGIPEERIRVERFTPSSPALHSRMQPLLATSALALLIGLIWLGFGPLAPPPSIRLGDFSFLWRDFFWQQTSGYTALGLSALGALISLRKRVRKVRFLHYDWWRLVHTVFGVMTLAALAAHTGLRLGLEFNRWLAFWFLGLTLMGALAGGLTYQENRAPSPTTHRLKTWLQRAHIAFAWPLPVLVAIHIVAAYWFRGIP